MGYKATIRSGTKIDQLTSLYIYSFSRDVLYVFNSSLNLTSFSDNFTVNTQKDTVYGRNDPIVSYSGTQRAISFGATFNELTSTETEIDGQSLIMLTSIAGGLYPRYETLENNFDTNVLKSPPLMAIHIPDMIVGGFIPDPYRTFMTTKVDDQKNPIQVDTDKIKMLTGYIDSFNISYDVKDGLVANDAANIQREYSISIAFTPIHPTQGGFDSKGNDFNNGWPW